MKCKPLKDPFVLVIVTASNRQEAEKIAGHLLDKRLIACANIIGPVSSLFWWTKKIEKAEEHILLMKSRLDKFKRLSRTVKELHSYKVPEIIALPIIEGSSKYLEWLASNLAPEER